MLRNAGFWTSLVVLLLAELTLIVEPQPMVALRNLAFDSFQRWQPREYVDTRVRIVDIDDASLARRGQWPWPRSQHAALVHRLTELGARVVAFDVIFSEPDMHSPEVALARWAAEPEIGRVLAELPSYDAVFAETVSRTPVVLGFSMSPFETETPSVPPKAGFASTGDDARRFIEPNYGGMVPPLPALAAAARGLGALNFTGDASGIIRRVPAVLRQGDSLYPILWLEAMRVAGGHKGFVVRASGARDTASFGAETGIVSVAVGPHLVPTDGSGHLWLHYTPSIQERYVPAWAVLAGEVAPGTFEDSIVFVGTSAAGLKDLRYTPFGIMAGVEVHAQAVEQVLGGTYLTRPAWARAAEALFLAALWLALLLLISRLGALWSALFGLATVALAVFASWHAFTEYRMLVDPLFPTLSAIALYLSCSLPRHMQSERQQRWIRQAFSSYISPNLVQHLIEHPEALNLGGERRECSFVMSDLAGFTALVERSDPAEVVALLNGYLEGMTRIALAHEGTLDRIVGDAVAVMFSAPVPQPDHAARAVACALAMDAFANRFRQERAAKGIALGHTRIGINTGFVIIGNVGGEALVDYRALGDAVNTTSRLEGANRLLGTTICVSGRTVAQVPDFVGRPIGALLLSGKSEAVQAFEPLLPEQLAAPAMQRYLEAYRLMQAEAPEALDAFRALAAEAPDDPLAALHARRLAAGETGATVVFESK